jgi:GT2 family glycosyltransferase
MIRLGGFIITYNRPEVLLKTIEKVFSQTFPPEMLWIIDNSPGKETQIVIESLKDAKLRYHRMGYNSGPAGGAGKGLELCGREKLDWIYWGDDNDPPFRTDCFERLLAIRDFNPFVGVLGTVGHFFDRKKGVIKRVQTRLLDKKDIVEVDYVAGGMCMLVSGNVARDGIAPDPGLFFGFEELDFCLKVKRKGYSILVDSGLFRKTRELKGRLEFEPAFYKKKTNLTREYYSLRNLLFISDSLNLKKMKYNVTFKWLVKSLFGFKYGLAYGGENFIKIYLGFYHYLLGKNGEQLKL